MDIVHKRAVGMDISKRDAKVCIRIPGKRKGAFESTVSISPSTDSTWSSTSPRLAGCGGWTSSRMQD